MAATEQTQYCVGLEHKPGMLTQLCHSLREKGINIEALFVTNEADVAWVNFVASPEDVVPKILESEGYKYFTEKVLTVEAKNTPGEIEAIAARLAEFSVNINFIYGSGTSGYPSKIVISVDGLQRAKESLSGKN